MKKRELEQSTCKESCDDSCVNTKSKKFWTGGIIGIVIVIIVSIFIYNSGQNKALTMGQAGQQAAFAHQNRVLICPFCNSPFYCPVGDVISGKVQCPYCLKNVVSMNSANAVASPAAFTQQESVMSCPFCGSIFYYANKDIINGTAQCPYCRRHIALGDNANSNPAPIYSQGAKVAQTNAVAAPPIFRDAVMLHEYRGVCSNCHVIKADVPIAANAQMLHKYRGVCSNCHTILGSKPGAR